MRWFRPEYVMTSKIYNQSNNPSGITLIEMLLVMSVMVLLTSIGFAEVTVAQAKARDAQRIADMKTIEQALHLYYLDHGTYPNETTTGGLILNGWEVSFYPDFIETLQPFYLPKIPVDPVNSGPLGEISWSAQRPDGTFFYAYHFYNFADAGSFYGCPWTGSFAVLAFRSLEAGRPMNLPKAHCGPYPCPGGPYNPPLCRDWSGEFDYSVLLPE